MSRARKFDHDAAKRMRRDGATYRAIAAALGVSKNAVRVAVNPHARLVHNRVNLARYRRVAAAPSTSSPGGAAS